MCRMNLQQLIDNRLFLNNLQRESLIEILSHKQSRFVKEAIREGVNNRFYSLFDEYFLSKNIEVKETYLEFKKNTDNRDIKKCREMIVSIVRNLK